MPLISVIVPVYNAEKYLKRCIESILNQAFKDFELILINDGSKDSSGVICDEYTRIDKRVKVIHRENGGVSRARNTGLDNSLGKYITFIDSDDYVKNNLLSDMIPYLENYDYDFVFGEKTLIINGKIECFEMAEEEYTFPQLYEKYVTDQVTSINVGPPFAKLFRKSIIDTYNIRFEDSILYGEDVYFNFTYMKYCSKIKAINKSAYMYVVENTDSLFSKVRSYTYGNMCELYHYLSEIASECGCDDSVHKRLLSLHIDESIAIVNKAVITSEKTVCIKLFREMADNHTFVSNISLLKKSRRLYVIAYLISKRQFNAVYCICKVWRLIRRGVE